MLNRLRCFLGCHDWRFWKAQFHTWGMKEEMKCKRCGAVREVFPLVKSGAQS
jgi:hypothetical protein